VLIVVVAPDYVIRADSLRRVQSLFSDDTGESAPDAAVVGRLTENLAALNVFLDYPVWGVGPGQFFRNYSMDYANALNMSQLSKNRRAHNLYLEIAADTGLIGLSAFMAIVVVTMVQLWRLRRYWLYRRPDSANMLTAFFLSVVAYLAAGMFLQLSYQRYYWLLLTLANSAIYVYQRETRPAGSLDRLTVEKSETGPMSLQGDRLPLPSYHVNTPLGRE
jgi:O-antigen ligase